MGPANERKGRLLPLNSVTMVLVVSIEECFILMLQLSFGVLLHVAFILKT